MSNAEKANDLYAPSAQLMLGMIYQAGDGVPKDLNEAHKWYTLTAKAKNEIAQKMLESIKLESIMLKSKEFILASSTCDGRLKASTELMTSLIVLDSDLSHITVADKPRSSSEPLNSYGESLNALEESEKKKEVQH